MAIKTYTWHFLLVPKSDTMGYDITTKMQAYAPSYISENKKVTEDILNDLHEKIDSLTIISGMAKGIDGIAMRTAIKNSDNVIAILGSGIDNPYPKENIDIYEYCKTSNKGLILSEYPLDTKPLKENFPIRNRLIAGLCDCVFVPEAKIKL